MKHLLFVVVSAALLVHAAPATATAPAPRITLLTPSSVEVGAGLTYIRVRGLHFTRTSKVSIDGRNVAAFYVSAAELDASLDLTKVTSGHVYKVAVSGAKSTLDFTLKNPVPKLSWTAPYRFETGMDPVMVALKGTGFDAATVVKWGSTALKVTSRTSDMLRVTLDSARNKPVSRTLSVTNPAPGGGSASLKVNVVEQPPRVTALSPGFALPGAADFTLTVTGSHFDPAATVEWGGVPLTTSFVSDSELQATVPAADVADAGVYAVTVVNPGVSDAIASVPASFAVDATGTRLARLTQDAYGMTWDATRFVFYGTVASDGTDFPSSIITVDPQAAAVTAHADTVSEPRLLSVSADGQYLYVSEWSGTASSIVRMNLPDLSVDFTKSAGKDQFGNPNVIADLQVSPVYPHIVAAIYQDPASDPRDNQGGRLLVDKTVTILGEYSDVWDVLGWSPDGTKLYAGDDEISSEDLYVFDMKLDHVSREHDLQGAWHDHYTAMHVDPADGFLYTDEGLKVDPKAGTYQGEILDGAQTVPDSTLGCVFTAYQSDDQEFSHDYTLDCDDPDTLALKRSMVLSNLPGPPYNLARWGNEGLMFQSFGNIYFLSGQFVTGE